MKRYAEAMDILSAREKEILELVGQLYSNKQIADKLGITIRTVHKHKENIRHKVGVRGRGELTRWYFNGVNGAKT